MNDLLIQRYCTQCDAPFLARRTSARYCSAACKSRAARQRRNGTVRSWEGLEASNQHKLQIIRQRAPLVARYLDSLVVAEGRYVAEKALTAAVLALNKS